MSIIEFLSQNTEEEEMPEWLQQFSPSFNLEDFFDPKYRTLFYPGPRFDGHPIRVCSMAHVIHTFVYVDVWEPAEKIVSKFRHPDPC